MSFIHNLSCECTKSQLDLFEVPPTQTSVEWGEYRDSRPISSIGPDTDVEIVAMGTNEHYIDLSQTLLVVKVKIVKSDGSPLDPLSANAEVAAASLLAPVNNFMHSMWRSVKVYLNQKPIASGDDLYPYRAYFHTLFNYNEAAKSTQCQSQLWYEDTANCLDECNIKNAGFLARSDYVTRDQTFEMMGQLYTDVTLQNRYLLNGVNMVVKLTPSKPAFTLMTSASTPNARVELVDVVLKCLKLKLNPSVLLAHSMALEKAAMKIPISRVCMKSETLPKGTLSKELPTHFNGQIPTRIILGFVSNAALNGTFKTNPFNFKHYDLCRLSLLVDGQRVPSIPLQPDYVNECYIESYFSTFLGTGLQFKDDGHCISRADYPHGYCLYAFDLTPDRSANDCHWTLRKNGSLSIDVAFKTALPEAVSCVTFGEFQNLIQIDKQRNVTLDY